MPPETIKLLVGICLIVPLVVIVNLALISAFRKRSNQSQGGMPQRAMMELRRPWKQEDDRLEELSRRVADLRHTEQRARDGADGQPPEEPGQGV